MRADVREPDDRLLKNITPNWLIATSKGPPGTVSVCMSTVKNVMVSAPDSTARRSASARSGVEMSAPTTAPIGPTARAAAIDVLPPPEPTSSTRSPGCSAAASRT